MKATVYSIDGKDVKKIDLPEVFSEDYRPDMITRAVTAIQSHRLQPHASDPWAGLKSSARYHGRRAAYRSGINKGMSRLPRIKTGGGGLGAVRLVSHAVGGPKAFPPQVEKVLAKELNKKERRLAIRSAIAATANPTLVAKRGHVVEAMTFPIIFEDDFEKLDKTQKVVALLEKLGLEAELVRAKVKKVRAGKGTKRGRAYRKKKSFLVVVAKAAGITRACRNLPGVDVTCAEKLNAELLAPGTHAGRLTIWTESALKKAEEVFGR